MSKQAEHSKSQFQSSRNREELDTAKLIDAITEGLLEKKAKNIVVLDVRELTTLADYFVVSHGTSETQIRALANSVEARVKEETGEQVWKVEGKDARRWVILDFVNVVVHIFSEEKREYYGIERMWNDAKVTEISDTPVQ